MITVQQHAVRAAMSVAAAIIAACGVSATSNGQITLSSPIDGGLIADSANYNSSYKYAWSAGLVELPNKDLMCVWRAGTKEMDVLPGPLYSIKPYGTSNWTAPRELFNLSSYNEVNPSPFIASNGQVWVFYRRYEQGINALGDMYRAVMNYDPATRLFSLTNSAQQLLNTSNQPFNRSLETGAATIRLTNGNILIPVTDKSNGGTGVLRSADDGAHWTYNEIPQPSQDPYHSMPTIAQKSDGTVVAYTRTFGSDFTEELAYRSTSTNNGQTWSAVTTTSVKSPNAKLAVVTDVGDMQYIVHNDMFRTASNTATSRRRLDIKRSTDGGVNWQNKIIEYDPVGEIGYPTAIRASDGYTYTVYGYRPTDIKFAKFNSAWFDFDQAVYPVQTVASFQSKDQAIQQGWTLNSTDTQQQYGFSNTSNAGGTTGEMGGTFRRTTSASFFGDTDLGGYLSDDQRISASGRIYLKNQAWDGAINIGFFSREQALANKKFLGFRLNEPGGMISGYRVASLFVNESGTSRNSSYLTPADQPAAGVPDQMQLVFNLEFDPIQRSLELELRFADDNSLLGITTLTNISAFDFTFDSFGIVKTAQGGTNTSAVLQMYMDNVSYTTMAVPEPAAVGVAALAGMLLIRIRHETRARVRR